MDLRPRALGGEAPPAVVGIVEMGGVSLQVTFEAERDVPRLFTVPLGAEAGGACTLFTHSFAGWGREAALDRIVRGRQSACFNEGYTSPRGARSLQALCLHDPAFRLRWG